MTIRPVIKSFFPVLVVILILSKIVIAEESGISENMYGRLSALQCDSLINANDTNPNFVILDVRTKGEWEGGHISGSIYRSTGDPDFFSQLDLLPKHKIFLLHCRSGGRSAGAYAKMKELGFTEVYEMIGGIISWNNNGLPTTKTPEPKLMLVSYSEILKGNNSDTIEVTVTNRANGSLTFSEVYLSDIHSIEHNFYAETVLKGAQDYTFSLVHSPGYYGDDSTKIDIESNGGMINLNIVFKNGSITNTNKQQLAELSLYPNPVNQRLFIKNNGFTSFDEISVINIVGQKVISKSKFSVSNGIDVSNLKNGIFILRLKTGNQIISQKFIVKH